MSNSLNAPLYFDVESAQPFLISAGDSVKLAVVHHPVSSYSDIVTTR